MDKKTQERIIMELCDTLRAKMLGASCRIPSEWDGIELREWLKTIVNTEIAHYKMPKKRAIEFYNTIIINNL